MRVNFGTPDLAMTKVDTDDAMLMMAKRSASAAPWSTNDTRGVNDRMSANAATSMPATLSPALRAASMKRWIMSFWAATRSTCCFATPSSSVYRLTTTKSRTTSSTAMGM